MPDIPSLGTVRNVPTGQVKPSPDNPRRIPAKAIEVVSRSLREFGWQQPLVVDADHVLIVGHTRHAAAKEMGLQSVPVVIAENLTPEQVKAYRIADNRTNDYTSWDFPELVQQLNSLDEDFREVLDLEDWQAVVSQLDAAEQAESESLAAVGGDFDLSSPAPLLPGERPAPDSAGPAPAAHDPKAPYSGQHIDYIAGGFELGVVFDSREAALRAATEIIDLEGCVDVRHKLK